MEGADGEGSKILESNDPSVSWPQFGVIAGRLPDSEWDTGVNVNWPNEVTVDSVCLEGLYVAGKARGGGRRLLRSLDTVKALGVISDEDEDDEDNSGNLDDINDEELDIGGAVDRC